MLIQVSATGRDHTHVVKSAVRTLEILEYFDEIRCPANVVTVSEALGYPQSSTAALLRSMVTMGYLQYDARARTYLPTDRVSLLGSWISPPLFEDGALLRMMRAIQKRTGQLVLIGARNGDFAQYVHVLKQPEAVAHHIQTGMKRPLATSGVGHALLSALPDQDVRRLVHRLNAYAAEAGERVDIAELLPQLTRVRRRGYAFSKHRVVENYGMIAIKLPSELASRLLVIGIGGCVDTLQARESELVTVAREEMANYLANKGADSEGEFRLRLVSDQPAVALPQMQEAAG
ncbi:DNA-binding IclR family transcriptional regulator [Xanthobacter sp. SG618]|uniref:IclR family transcriptional regulator n=1 Tax=Xanthobacter sp. SG618 TaxID=2587121 RepID=UPI00145DDBC6|nr:helix-turn-helix domain-containing protein [Xanthobacter sp. SG618]NMN58496.1 DNA-binding IclR family transcriptional regulator [Xanthobacter sp. SG618]